MTAGLVHHFTAADGLPPATLGNSRDSPNARATTSAASSSTAARSPRTRPSTAMIAAASRSARDHADRFKPCDSTNSAASASRSNKATLIRVQVVRGQRNSLAIPESALQISGESTFAFVIVKQGDRVVTDQRPVVTGLRQDNMVEVREGLDAGDQVVADGLNKVQPGQAVRVGGSAAGPRPASAGAPRS